MGYNGVLWKMIHRPPGSYDTCIYIYIIVYSVYSVYIYIYIYKYIYIYIIDIIGIKKNIMGF